MSANGIGTPLEAIGEHAIADFMAHYWQREAYLARSAFSDFKPLLSVDELLKLATLEDVESRFIHRTDEDEWRIESGPFSSQFFKKLPSKNWTILVQGVNLWNSAADELLRRFAFIPYARLDDLMISYAVDGGGVGPHFDSYDVFLLQAYGQRRWSIGAQQDLTLRDDVPLKILESFQAEQSWVLDPGDMLYLPPRYAHDGVAMGECMTYSIGFRAPSDQEWARGFLGFWQDELALEGLYHDAGLKTTTTPADIPDALRHHVIKVIQQKLWSEPDIERFIGCYLTEPKPTVFFNALSRPYSVKRFREAILKSGILLNQKTQMLYDRQALYCNGESVQWEELPIPLHSMLHRLADRRILKAEDLATIEELGVDDLWYLHEGYQDGYWGLGQD
jgi:50S ribosomal protein L16 3-hydroxylase